MSLKTWWSLGLVVVIGCGDDEVDDTVGSESASMGATSMADGTTGEVSTSAAPTTEAPTGSESSASETGLSTGGGECTPADPGRLCVRGTPGDKGEELIEDEPLSIMVDPFGCYSSGCTVTPEATCEVEVAGADLTLTAAFCIGTEGKCIKPDCSGAQPATCTSTALPAGDYTITLGELTVSFTIPSTIDYGGLCDGTTV